MYIVSLIMLYSFGLRENAKTEKLTDKDRKYVINVKKIRKVITPGGEFAQGKEINKIVRDLANYLCTGNRISSFQEAKKQHAFMDLSL